MKKIFFKTNFNRFESQELKNLLGDKFFIKEDSDPIQ
jgi:hypothetical protein